jgi:isopentenyl-diphosphate Delta-isomerase
LDCAVRRLQEEVGIVMEMVQLHELYSFYYQAKYNQDWSEHEVDTVVVGEYFGNWVLNPEEAVDAKWIEWEELSKDMEVNPDFYAPWPKMIFEDKRLLAGLKI